MNRISPEANPVILEILLILSKKLYPLFRKLILRNAIIGANSRATVCWKRRSRFGRGGNTIRHETGRDFFLAPKFCTGILPELISFLGV